MPNALQVDCDAVVKLLQRHKYQTAEQIIKRCKMSARRWRTVRRMLTDIVGSTHQGEYTLI